MGKRKGSHGVGTWSFPGGHLDPGETVEEAVRRELFEETGIAFKGELSPTAWVENHFESKGRYVTLYMTGRVEGLNYVRPELCEPEKCEEWRWVDVNALPKPLFAPIEKLLQSGFVLIP